MPEVVLGACLHHGKTAIKSANTLNQGTGPDSLQTACPWWTCQHKGKRPRMRLRAVQTPLRAHRPWVRGCRLAEVRWEHLPAMQDAEHGMHQPKHLMPCRHGKASSMPAGDVCHVMPLGGPANGRRCQSVRWCMDSPAPPSAPSAMYGPAMSGALPASPSRPAVVLWAMRWAHLAQHLQAHLLRRRSRRPPRHRPSCTSRHRETASAGQQEPSRTRHGASARAGQLCILPSPASVREQAFHPQ